MRSSANRSATASLELFAGREVERFGFLLENAISFLRLLGLERIRTVDCTDSDPGYHERKVDIEVWTEAYGWLETHSCTSFGREQSRRFEITGADHTLSNTGIALPRILVPLMEAEGIIIR